jgi:hypothetical protein
LITVEKLLNLIMSKKYISYLVHKKKAIRDEIEHNNKINKGLSNDIDDIEKALFNTCYHDFYRCGDYDDLCRYRCKKCECYSNKYIYK